VEPYVRLLGRPSVEIGDERHEPPFGRGWAMLMVLAARGGWVDRGELIYLFWPDHDEQRARANLRKLLSRTPGALPFARSLDAEPSRLRWQVATDLAEFRTALTEGRLAHAVTLYRGPFLDGVRAEDLPEFEAWLDTERVALARAWRDAGTTLASQAAAEGRRDDAAWVLHSLVEADPLDEEALQAYLRALAAVGRGAAAAAAYRAFAEHLERELGATPSVATRALAEAAATTAATATHGPPRKAALRGLPRNVTPFVGRTAERARLSELLRDPTCRLITITAPGGFGKTRLALAVAGDHAADFSDGVAFVPLATVESADQAPFTLADALGVTLTGNRSALEQLRDALAERHQLVVLDNVEHLVDEIPWLAGLIEAGTQVRWLVTSRERLDLEGEWRFELQGLALPRDDEPPGDAATQADAVRFFMQRAAREQAAATTPAEVSSVLRICRAVEGMPLALDLAASWVGTLGLEEIAEELERDLGLLVASGRGHAERQRSVNAVFEASLTRLSPDGRALFEALAIFPGSFDRAAASAIATATPMALRELVARSLLGASGGGRFRLHELLRRFASARLAVDPERERTLRAAHARHYAEWLAANEPALSSRALAAVLAHIDLERDNVIAALTWHLQVRDLQLVPAMAAALEIFFAQRTRFASGAALLGDAAAGLASREDPSSRRVSGALLMRSGWLAFRGGAFESARASAERAAPLLDGGADPALAAENEGLLGALVAVTGNYLGALGHFERALVLARRADTPTSLAGALNNLAITEKQLGHYRSAEAHYRESLALSRRTGSALNVARNLNNLGLLLLADGRSEEAEAILREGLALARSIDAKQVVPHLLGGLAKAALARGDNATARTTSDEAARLTAAAGARGSLVAALCTLAIAAAGEGDDEAARSALMGAAGDARETGNVAGLLATVAAAGRVASLTGDHRAALLALSLVRDDPRLERALRAETLSAWEASCRAVDAGDLGPIAEQARLRGLEGTLQALGLVPGAENVPPGGPPAGLRPPA
jgi:predicted ATPase/DNA-binding SARP family transcriptional activator